MCHLEQITHDQFPIPVFFYFIAMPVNNIMSYIVLTVQNWGVHTEGHSEGDIRGGFSEL